LTDLLRLYYENAENILRLDGSNDVQLRDRVLLVVAGDVVSLSTRLRRDRIGPRAVGEVKLSLRLFFCVLGG
jgi:hypothetical protein